MAEHISGVKHIIAIASGKGGVGKSTTCANIALAMQQQGWRIGVLDADIYGPSQPMILGVTKDQRPETQEGKYFLPVNAHGLQMMSMGLLVDEKTPMVWRGPMISSALMQMLQQTRWNQLDCLLIDMPPGTGDIQLSISQKVAITGAVIITTPQDVALLDVRKALAMFAKVGVACLGVIENMATYVCTQCGHEEFIFGSGGGEQLAHQAGVDLLGRLPLDVRIRMASDTGIPVVIADSNSVLSQHYLQVASQLMQILRNGPDLQGNMIVKQK